MLLGCVLEPLHACPQSPQNQPLVSSLSLLCVSMPRFEATSAGRLYASVTDNSVVAGEAFIAVYCCDIREERDLDGISNWVAHSLILFLSLSCVVFSLFLRTRSLLQARLRNGMCY